MADIDKILKQLGLLGVKDTKRVAKAVREHLEELDEIAAYDAAQAKKEPTESLESVLSRYSKPKRASATKFESRRVPARHSMIFPGMTGSASSKLSPDSETIPDRLVVKN